VGELAIPRSEVQAYAAAHRGGGKQQALVHIPLAIGSYSFFYNAQASRGLVLVSISVLHPSSCYPSSKSVFPKQDGYCQHLVLCVLCAQESSLELE
jgi:hypothetical protein